MIKTLMKSVMKPLAILIVGQKITLLNGTTKNAGPRFDHYPTGANPTLRKLYEAIKKELEEASRTTAEDDIIIKAEIARILAATPIP